MKKLLLIPAVALALLASGCKEKNAQPATSATAPEKKTDSITLDDSVFISGGWTLCAMDDDGTMISKKQSEIGDLVKIVRKNGQKTETVADWKFKDSTRTKDINWVLVEYDSAQYYTRDLFIADTESEAFIPGVITEDTRIYSDADDMSMTAETLTAGTKVAVSKKYGSDSFAKICVYNGRAYGKNVYVERQAVAGDSGVIEYYTLMKKLERNPDLKPEVRQELEDLLLSLSDEQDNE